MGDEPKPPAGRPSDENYEIGYCKPPRHTQFQPGSSGNPRGRPKGTKNLKTDLLEELGEKVVVREGDRSQNVSKQRAVVKSLVAHTLKGDARAATLLMSMMMRLLDTGEGAPEAEDSLVEDEREVLKALGDRLQRSSNAPARAASNADAEADDAP